MSLFYELTGSEKSQGYIYGILADNNIINYSLGTNYIQAEPYAQKSIQVEKKKFVIEFDGNGGNGVMTAMVCEKGDSFILPDCVFTASAGYVFDGWSINDNYYNVGESVTPMGNINVKALWKKETNLNVKINHSCTLQNNLSLNYKVKINTAGSFENVRLAIEKQVFAGSDDSYTWVTDELKNYTVGADGRYQFYYRGIAAAEMGNLIRVKVMAEKDGVTYESAVDEYSLRQYAFDILNLYTTKTDETSKKLCELMVDMLNYGAKAQLYFKRNTGNLANAGLSTEWQALGSAIPETYASVADEVAVEGATAVVASRSLVLQNAVELKTYLTFDAVPGEGVYVKYSYTSTSGTAKEEKVYSKDFVYESAKDRYAAKISSVAAADFKKPITIAIYDGTKQISNTYTFSYETYVKLVMDNGATGTLKELLEYMMAYGNAAKEYFELIS